MKWIADQDYLKSKQYGSAANLEARIQLHKRFGQDEQPWSEWLMNHIPLQAGSRIVDIGCGPASLWRDKLLGLPQGNYVLADLSLGMVRTSVQTVGGDARFRFLQADAQHLPLPGAYFDVALANHMLYHVPDIQTALLELKRVIKPEGWLCAATNGRDNLHELHELLIRYLPGYPGASDSAARFGLEGGAEMIAKVFPDVKIIHHTGDLWVTETAPLVDYILSMWGTESSDMGWIRALAQEVDAKIEQEGGLRIRRVSGLILAHR